MQKRQKIIIIIVILLLSIVLVTAGLLTFRKSWKMAPERNTSKEDTKTEGDREILPEEQLNGNNETGAVNEIDGNDETEMSGCFLLLQADKTQLYINEDGDVLLTVASPYLSGENTIIVSDEDQNEVCRIKTSDMVINSSGMMTAEFHVEVDTSSDHIERYTAKLGENLYSPELCIYITPVISEADILTSLDVGFDISSYIEKTIPDADPAKKATAAESWLNGDDRVLEASVQQDEISVQYVTKAHVGGVYCAEKDDPEYRQIYAGINEGDSKKAETETALTDLFDQFGTGELAKNNTELFNSTTKSYVSTNQNVLVLVPCREEMDGKTCDEIIEAANDLSYKVYGATADILEGDAAVQAIVGQKLNEYGTVVLFTHGNSAQRSDDGSINTFYLLHSENYTEENRKEVRDNVVRHLKQYASEAYNTDHDGYGTFRDFYSYYYAENGSDSLNTSARMYLIVTPENCKIRMTANFLIDRYQEQYFDNTIIYLAACHGLACTRLNEFLLNRGCSFVLGHMSNVAQGVLSHYVQQLGQYLSEASDLYPEVNREMLETLGLIGKDELFIDQSISAYCLSKAAYEELTRSGEEGRPLDGQAISNQYRAFLREELIRIYGQGGDSRIETDEFPLFNEEEGETIRSILEAGITTYLSEYAGKTSLKDPSTSEDITSWLTSLSGEYFNEHCNEPLEDLIPPTVSDSLRKSTTPRQNLSDSEFFLDPFKRSLRQAASDGIYRKARMHNSGYTSLNGEKALLGIPMNYMNYDNHNKPDIEQDNTLYYGTHQPVFSLKGNGKLKGKTVIIEVDENGDALNADQEPEIADGARVTAYLLRGRRYQQIKTAFSDDEGVFVFEGLPMGHLILVAEKNIHRSKTYSCYFVDVDDENGEPWDAGTLAIEKKPSGYDKDALFKWGVVPARTDKGGKYGYLAEDGTWAIRPFFDKAYAFSCNTIAFVKESGKSTFSCIDLSGKIIFDGIKEIIEPFGENGIAYVKLEEEAFLSYKDGQIQVIPASELGIGEIESFHGFTHPGFGIVQGTEKAGILGADLSVIVDPRTSPYEYIQEVSEGFYWACESSDCWTEPGFEISLITAEGSIKSIGTINVPLKQILWSNGYGLKSTYGSWRLDGSEERYQDYEVINVRGDVQHEIHLEGYDGVDGNGLPSVSPAKSGWFMVSSTIDTRQYNKTVQPIASFVFYNFMDLNGNLLFPDKIRDAPKDGKGWIFNGIYDGHANIVLDENKKPVGVKGMSGDPSADSGDISDKVLVGDVVMDLDGKILYFPSEKGFSLRSQYYSDGYVIAFHGGRDTKLVIANLHGEVIAGKGMELTSINDVYY